MLRFLKKLGCAFLKWYSNLIQSLSSLSSLLIFFSKDFKSLDVKLRQMREKRGKGKKGVNKVNDLRNNSRNID